MTDFKEGDVVLVSYPFGEGAGVRKRPALVISRNNFNQQTEELIVAQITREYLRRIAKEITKL